MDIRIHPADADRWADVVAVMGVNGAFSGCWCMFWRLTNQQIQGNTADDNRAGLEAAVCSGEPAGLLLYDGTEPIGWCSVAPRPVFARLARTKGITPDDPHDPSVWSIVCVFIKRDYRRNGLTGVLLDAAVEFAGEHGAAIVEGYPVADGDGGSRGGLSSGTVGLFTRAGFTMHVRPSTGRRVVMRRPP